jgi:hypothetical protein
MFNMYIEIDSLLDTRLSLISLLSPKLAHELITGDYYVSRDEDKFSFISSKIFSKLYAERDARVLKVPRPTGMRDVIISYLLEQKKESMMLESRESIVLFINVKPYIISAYEKGILLTGFKAMLPRDIDIKIIDEDVTPEFMMQNDIITMFMYEGLAWLNREQVAGRLKPYQLTDKVLFVPMSVKASMENVDSFMEVMKPIIRVEFTDNRLWSSIDLVMIKMQKEKEEMKDEDVVNDHEPQVQEEELIVDLSFIEEMTRKNLASQ